MKLGTDRKKIYVLGALLLFGGYEFYDNVLSSPSASAHSRPSRKTTARPDAAVPAVPPSSEAPSRRTAASSRSSEEFRPSLKPKRPEDRVDPMSIDPTLRLDLLAKVQAVALTGGSRNLFAAGPPPPAALPPEPAMKIAGMGKRPAGPEPPPPPPAPQLPPPPPPITLKYYGYSSAKDNRKHAFFLDGDDILVAAEGETVKKRYRVVRIGVNSVVMEDTQFKHEQTLPLAEEAAG
jgi:hypothetical protein